MAQVHFTNDEMVDMVLIYGECKKNSIRALQLYRNRYPERRQPRRQYFNELVNKMRTNGSFINKNRHVRGNNEEDNQHNEEEERVLAYLNYNSEVSLRELSRECAVSCWKAHKILKKHKYKSYKFHISQFLRGGRDNERRLNFCNWFLQMWHNDNRFHFKILFSDESYFCNNGLFNRNNLRRWATENPRELRSSRYQERFGFNVWLGIIGTKIVGPIIFQGTLTAQRYLEFLQNEVEDLLDDLPIANIVGMWFQQDGAPAHNARNVVTYLNARYEGNWIGTNSPNPWPARSPDLTPLDYFLWGFLKDRVYRTPPTTLENLEMRVRTAIREIQVNMLQNVMEEFVLRMRKCVENDGGHIEHL